MGKKGKSHRQTSFTSQLGSGGGDGYQKSSLHHHLRYHTADYVRFAKQDMYIPPNKDALAQRKHYNSVYLRRLVEDRLHFDRREEQSATAYWSNRHRQHIMQHLSNKPPAKQSAKYGDTANSEMFQNFSLRYQQQITREMENLGSEILSPVCHSDSDRPEEKDVLLAQKLQTAPHKVEIKALTTLCIECIIKHFPDNHASSFSSPYHAPTSSSLFSDLCQLIPGLPPEQVEYISFCLGVCGQLSLSTYPSLLLPLLQDQLA
ncbi:hypothetical protein EON65_36290, partial [archaeon]